MKFCKHCGLMTPDHAVQCPACGAVLPMAPPAAPTPPTPHYQAPPTDPDAPLTTQGYLLTLLTGWIPLAGLVILCIWALGGTSSHARQNLARACLIRTAIFSCLVFVVLVLITVVLVWTNPYYGISYFFY